MSTPDLFTAAAALAEHVWDAEGQVYDDLRAALTAERDRRERSAPYPGFVYLVRLPSDDFTETHVFADHTDAARVRDAVPGAELTEEPVLDASFAQTIIDDEAAE